MGHRLDVALQPGETLVANGAVEFPSGHYKRVWGFRSFRDFQGRDVSSRLPGWPPSKKPVEPPAKGSAKGVLLTGAWITLNLIVLLWEGAIGGDSAFADPLFPEDREDFRVLSADPGTVAFGAPWQLDPGRNKAKPRIVLHMTERRLLFTDPGSGALLWEIGRQDVRTVESRGGALKITFVDDSWIIVYVLKDEDSTVPSSDDAYSPIMVKGKPLRLPPSQDTDDKFRWVLQGIAPASPTESPSP